MAAPKEDRDLIGKFIITFIFFILTPIACIFGLGAVEYQRASNLAQELPNTVREMVNPIYLNKSDEVFDDSQLNLIEDDWVVSADLKMVTKLTGVQPYVVVLNHIDGNSNPTDEELYNYAKSVYDEKFNDDAHMVFVYKAPSKGGDYSFTTFIGERAKQVWDDSAISLLYREMESNLINPNKSLRSTLCSTFSTTSHAIMQTGVNTPNYFVLCIIGVISVFVLFIWSSALISHKFSC